MKFLKNIIAAFQFLTAIPLPVKTREEHLKRSLGWFPLVGAVIGTATGFGFQLFRLWFNENISAVFTILLYIILTRGLHLDGYMDTIDGFFSRKDRTSVLKIMKESVVGGFAVLGAGIWFLLVFSALPLLKPEDHIFIHMLSRMGILLSPLVVSYPRESGTGKFFVENVKIKTLLFGIIVAGIAGAVLWFAGLFHFPAYGLLFFVPFVAALIIALWSRRKIGGITGDVLGFTVETTHMLLIVSILLYGGLK